MELRVRELLTKLFAFRELELELLKDNFTLWVQMELSPSQCQLY